MKYLNVIAILLLFIACNKQTKTEQTEQTAAETSETLGYFTLEGDSVIIPSFEIEIVLSEKAEQKLKSLKETVIVSAAFTGIPKDTTIEEFYEVGGMSIVNKDIELTDSRVAKFENVKFSKATYEALADKDIELLINVFTGRRADPNNLISCDIVQDKMSVVQGKKYTLKGQLIEE